MSLNTELTVLINLLHDEEFRCIAYPHIKTEYFENSFYRETFKLFSEFVEKYSRPPTKESLCIDLQNKKNLPEHVYTGVYNTIQELNPMDVNSDWLKQTAETWCQKRAVYLAIFESIEITEGKDDTKDLGYIVPLLKDAITVSFDNHIGHNYLEDFEERYDFYTKDEEKIPFDIEYLNKITEGGLPKKTLNIILAGTGGGKSLTMCHMAAANLLQGYNVLYITCEMSEKRIAQRIDANLLNIGIKDLKTTPENIFKTKIKELRDRTNGELVIKEYPTSSAHVGHFRSCLSDLSLKKDFKPDIIFVDYINICASQRYRPDTANSYTLVKGIAEELRGLAVENDVPIVSATQTTRSGYGSSDVNLTDTSESFGLPATADLMFALTASDEDKQLGQVVIKQLKNRYNDVVLYERFAVGIDKGKMRLYDIEQSVQSQFIGNTNDDDEPPTSIGAFKFD